MARRIPSGQLSLFGEPEPTRLHADRGSALLAERLASFRPLADRLSDEVKFGTSSWSFPGWAGIVYPEGLSKAKLAQDGLPLYVQHPLLRTVGIDRGYYTPISEADLAKYATQLPPQFPTVAKVPAFFTTPVHLGHGSAARGESNPSFLDARAFTDVVARPFLSSFRDHTAALVLEFPPLPKAHRIEPSAFAKQLDAFLKEIPSELPYCVEVRDRNLLTPAYADVLSHHGVAHVFNYWSAMPMPADQLPVAPLDSAPFVVLRLMLRPGTTYAQRKDSFEPFNRLVDPDQDMRKQVVDLIEMARALRRVVLVLVNNKAEGSAPLTIEQLAQQLIDAH